MWGYCGESTKNQFSDGLPVVRACMSWCQGSGDSLTQSWHVCSTTGRDKVSTHSTMLTFVSRTILTELVTNCTKPWSRAINQLYYGISFINGRNWRMLQQVARRDWADGRTSISSYPSILSFHFSDVSYVSKCRQIILLYFHSRHSADVTYLIHSTSALELSFPISLMYLTYRNFVNLSSYIISFPFRWCTFLK